MRRHDRDAANVAQAERYKEAQKIVASGKCPDCGSKLRRNLALTGWWQCEQFGNEQFRARPKEPSCNFQTFTE